ncbi:MAG: ribbon-helix-helix protein, CopG family [Chloroflexi bacterium]|nr:ribbon-helix-helix protein, CopG family [Chloroflexota bacterium]
MIRTQISLTEAQVQRLRREARRRHVSLAAVIRDAVDRVVPDEDARQSGRIDRLLAAAGSAASGTGSVARDHDAVLAGDRW